MHEAIEITLRNQQGYRKKAEELNQMIDDTEKHHPKTQYDPLKKQKK
jgi:hypothetical protein